MPFVKFKKLNNSKEFAIDSLVVLRSMETRAEEIAREILEEASAGTPASTEETVTIGSSQGQESGGTGTTGGGSGGSGGGGGGESSSGGGGGGGSSGGGSGSSQGSSSGTTIKKLTFIDESTPHISIFPHELTCSNDYCVYAKDGSLNAVIVVLRKSGDKFTTNGSYVVFIEKDYSSAKKNIVMDVHGVYKIVRVEPGPNVVSRSAWYEVYYKDKGTKRIAIGDPRALTSQLISCVRSSGDLEKCIADALKLNVFFAELYKVSRDYYGRQLCNHSTTDVEQKARWIASGIRTPELEEILKINSWVPSCDSPSVYKYPFIPLHYTPVARVTPDDAVRLLVKGPGTSASPKYILVARKCESQPSEYIESPSYIDSVRVVSTGKLDRSTFRSMFTSEFSSIIGSELASRLADIIYTVLEGGSVDADSLAKELSKYKDVAKHLSGVADGIDGSCRILGAPSPYKQAWYNLHKRLLSYLQGNTKVEVNLKGECVARLDKRYGVYSLGGCTYYVVDTAAVPPSTAGSCGGTRYEISGRCIRFAMSNNYDFAGFDVICPVSLAGASPRDENARITCASQFKRAAAILRQVAAKLSESSEQQNTGQNAGQGQGGTQNEGSGGTGGSQTTTGGSGQTTSLQVCEEMCKKVSSKMYPDPSDRWRYCVAVTYECTRRDCSKYTKTETHCSRCTVKQETFTIGVHGPPEGTLSKCTLLICAETGHRIKLECTPISSGNQGSGKPASPQPQPEPPDEKGGIAPKGGGGNTTVILPPVGGQSQSTGQAGQGQGSVAGGSNANIGGTKTGTVVVTGGGTGAGVATQQHWQPGTYLSGSRYSAW